MDAAPRLDAHLAAALDALLSLASDAARAGRPELAQAAAAALDPLAPWLCDDTVAASPDPLPDLPGDRPHAEH